MIGTTKPTALPNAEIMPQLREKGFTIPNPQKDEVPEAYITALKGNAPCEYLTLGGINFEKAVLPADYSVVDSNGGKKKLFFPKLLTKMMTKSQADAIWAEAAKREIFIPTIQNPNFNSQQNSSQYLRGGSFKLSELIILEPLRTFDSNKYPPIGSTWQSESTPEIKPEDVKAELLELQRQPIQGKKK